jgi:hypothetical protein
MIGESIVVGSAAERVSRAHRAHAGGRARLLGARVSERARERGLHTVEALKRAVLHQRATWWQGNDYHCPLCDLDFGAAHPAAEHVVREQHPVLRMD